MDAKMFMDTRRIRLSRVLGGTQTMHLMTELRRFSGGETVPG
jgi:hypothetical protein